MFSSYSPPTPSRFNTFPNFMSFSFFNNLLILICAAHTLRGAGLSTGVRQTYLRPHPEREPTLPPLTTISCPRIFSKLQTAVAPPPTQTGLTSCRPYTDTASMSFVSTVIQSCPENSFPLILPNIWLFKSFCPLFRDGS